MFNKKVLLPAIAVVIGGGVLLGGSQLVNAQSTNGISGLAQAIAQKFGLDQGQVQNTISDYHTQHRSDMLTTHLDKLVQQGKINASQKQATIDELNKIKGEYNPADFKNLTPDQRKQKMMDLKNELDTWAKSQGIDPTILRPGFGFGRGMHRMGMGWNKPAPSATP